MPRSALLRPYRRWPWIYVRNTQPNRHSINLAHIQNLHIPRAHIASRTAIKSVAFQRTQYRSASGAVFHEQSPPSDAQGPAIIMNKQYSQVYKLIEDEDIRERYLQVLQNARNESLSTKDIMSIYTNFHNLIDIVSGFSSPEALDLLVAMWQIITSEGSVDESVQRLQDLVLSQKDKLVHITINHRRHQAYDQLIRPLYQMRQYKDRIEPTWADKLASTFQLQYDDGEISMNRPAIIRYLRNDTVPLATRRKMLSILVQSGMLHAQSHAERMEFARIFASLAPVLGDGHFMFLGSEHRDYTKVVRLLAMPSDESHSTDRDVFTAHVHSLRAVFDEDETFDSFMTSAMLALKFSPNTVLQYWRYKKDHSSPNGHDLKAAMAALCDSSLYREVLELYHAHSELHNEDHIEILLRVSELSKDWKLLQSQFEDMYGKGKLPYVIHYSIVMNALAGLGAREEVDMLYRQLQKRQLLPSASIFCALISSRLYYDDIDSAKTCFDQYLNYVDRNLLEGSRSAYLYTLLFKIHYKSRDLDRTMAFLDATLAEQRSRSVQLISHETICDLIAFAAEHYDLRSMERLRTLATELDLFDINTYRSLIRAYIRMDQYERASDLIYQAHAASDVPFQNSDIYATQLRLYRYWTKRTPSREQRLFLKAKQEFIVQMVMSNYIKVISVRNNSRLYVEVIKYYLGFKDIENATKVFNLAQKREILEEAHFVPFFDHHLHENSYESYGQILNFYRKMVDSRIVISSKTYVYLMKALIYLDSMNNKGGANAYKLLKSVFEMNGLSLNAKPHLADSPPKIMMSEIFQNSEDLFKIVSSYVLSSGSPQANIDLLVHFLNQIKEILNGKLSLGFRFLLYKEMSKIYEQQGNLELAENLIENGLDDFKAIVELYKSRYPYQDEDEDPIMPVVLVKDYRTLYNAKIKQLDYKRKPAGEYLTLLRSSWDQGVRLSGNQYNKLIKMVLRDDPVSNLLLVLSICEAHLVAGNFVEVKIMRKIQFMYKLTMLHISQGLSDEFALQKYRILNDYYDVSDLRVLRDDLRYIGDPLQALEVQIQTHSRTLNIKNWDANKIINDIPGFFIPERRIQSQNKISPSNCYKILGAIHEYCQQDQLKAFKLMDEFPETLEFLMYNDSARIRMGFFRNKIDKIEPPRNDYQETFEQRTQRTEQALKTLRDWTEESEYSMDPLHYDK